MNLGILAHVDAGRTSLTERILHAAGIIDEVGKVDDGGAQTDSLALERRRGITIKSAVVSFVVDVTLNLIDGPGHPDFMPRWNGSSVCSTARSWCSPPWRGYRPGPAS